MGQVYSEAAVRYHALSDERDRRMTAADFRRIALSLEGVEEWQEVRVARVAKRRLRQSDAHTGTAGSVRRGGARDLPADSWRLGEDGTHPYSPGCGERGCPHGRNPNSVETACR